MAEPSVPHTLTERAISRIADVVTRRPWVFIIGFVIVAAAMGSRIPTAEVEPEVKKQLPPDFPSLLDLDEIEKVFGGSDLLMITLVADDVLEPKILEQVQKLSEGVAALPQVDRVLSLFELKDIRNEQDTMVVSSAVERLPATAAEREVLRKNLKDNDLVYGTVVSKDFRATAIVGLLGVGSRDDVLVPAVRKLLAASEGPGQVHVAGMPIARVRMAGGIKNDMRRFFPAGLLVMLIFLFYFFRQLRGMLLPFLVVVMSALFTMGLIPVIGWKIQMITVILPVVLLAIANDYGIHLIARYQEVNTPGCDLNLPTAMLSSIMIGVGVDYTIHFLWRYRRERREGQTPPDAVRRTLTTSGRGIIINALSVVVGFGVMFLSSFLPVRTFGFLVVVSISACLVGAMVLMPALVLVLRPKFLEPVNEPDSTPVE